MPLFTVNSIQFLELSLVYATLTAKINRQLKFQLILILWSFPAKPGAPTNCTLRAPANRTSEILDVECRPGYDGGLPQIFMLEAYDANNMKMRLNLTSLSLEFPLFRLELNDLPPWEGSPPALRLVIYGMNAKGKGEKVVLEDIMLNDAEKRTGEKIVVFF